MHELSITEHLLEYCITKAAEQNAVKIRSVRLCIGALKGILPECIQVYLDLLSEGTIAEGMQVQAEILPLKVCCKDCGRNSEISSRQLFCPHCKSLHLQILSGKEFYIDSLEVDIDGNQSLASDHGME